MLKFIKKLFKRVSSSTASVVCKKVKSASRRSSYKHRPPLTLESLEARTLLAGFDLGDITDPAKLYFANDRVPTVIQFDVVELRRPPKADVYTFSLPRLANVIAALSDLQRTNLFDDTGARLSILSTDELTGASIVWATKEYPDGTTGELGASLPPGVYSILVGFGLDSPSFVGDDQKSLLKSYDLSIHADTAPVEFTGGDPLASEGRNLGTLSTSSGIDIREYIGIGNSGNPTAVQDQVDMHLFDLIKRGTVDIKVTLDATASGTIDFVLFRDMNGDGIFDGDSSLERLEAKTEITDGQTRVVSRILEPGRYGIAIFVNLQTATQAQVDNYRLRTTYTVADGAGNTLAAAKPVGSVDNFFKTFSDYISPNDPADFYKFDTVGNGPFVFEGTLSGMAPGSNFELDLFLDLDGDGNIDKGDLFSSRRASNTNEELTVPYVAPGTYFVRVRRTSGEGVYTLQFKNRNTDLAGNTMDGAAKNLGNFVFNELADRVSASDRFDFYKFELAVPSDFDVSMTGMPIGTNADLLLIHSKNGDSVIDKDEIIGSSVNISNVSEQIEKTLAPGVYFVRVKQIAGAPTYQLRLVHDRVGDTLAKAQPISQGGGTNLDFIGVEDFADVYKFTLGTARQIGIKVELNNEPLLIRLGQDINGNGLLDQTEERLSKTVSAGKGGFELVNLDAGLANFLLVKNTISIPADGTLYRVTLFNAKPDNAGNTLLDARDIGILGDAQIFSDPLGRGPVVQMDDLNDFYKFQLGENGPFQFVSQFSNVTGFVGFQLIRDNNQNQRIDSGEILATVASPTPNAPPPPISIRLDVRDTYYLRALSTNAAAYTVNMRAISLDTAGNSLSSVPPPLDLGPLVDTINSPNHLVADIDRNDFFRFSVNNPGELVASLSEAPNTFYRVIHDIDRDGVVDPGETLGAAFGSSQLHGVILPVAGDNYFVRVQTVLSGSPYALNLTFSNQTPFQTPFLIDAVNPTEIKSVRFDRGGENVSWLDTTPGNSGDNPTFRNPENIDVDVSTTIDVESTGRRVTNTAPGEFLEYTLIVAGSGFYDFDARVSSLGLGATFHLEIDGISLSLPVAVPDTGSEDEMVTIVGASNVPLVAGPHILRLAIDAGTTGSFNFIRVRPATTGTFELTPTRTTVAAHKHTNLTLAWTVPVGGWKVLKHVDIRLRDDNGRLLWIRFDEATNTMSMYNQATRKFGLAREVGSNRVLRGPLAKVYMRTTTVAANGPNDPTVAISFDIKFRGNARGHWTVEAAARDDLGHRDPFKFAGEIDVV